MFSSKTLSRSFPAPSHPPSPSFFGRLRSCRTTMTTTKRVRSTTIARRRRASEHGDGGGSGSSLCVCRYTERRCRTGRFKVSSALQAPPASERSTTGRQGWTKCAHALAAVYHEPQSAAVIGGESDSYSILVVC